MVEIIFEAHATTLDNERHIASGHYDVGLSKLGIQQAKELGIRYKKQDLDAIFCSDLQRSYKTAEIAFGNLYTIIKDARLRECDYGSFTRLPSDKVDAEKTNRISDPFPGGKSYQQAVDRMKRFLLDVMRDYQGKKVMIIGHRATQYGLEHLLNGVPLKPAITNLWKWQPGWRYRLSDLPATS